MASHELRFKIINKIAVHLATVQNRAVILCETDDGKKIHLEADYPTLDKIHQEIQKLLERY
jgi:hypothetical protein